MVLAKFLPSKGNPVLSDNNSGSEKPVIAVATSKEAAPSGLFGVTDKRLSAEGERREDAASEATSACDGAGPAVAAGEEQV